MVTIVENGCDLPLNPHRWQRPWRTSQLPLGLRHVILIKVRVTKRMDELAQAQSGDLGHHHGQQRVRSNVERYAEEHIGAALVELARETTTVDVKLEQHMTRWQRHLGQLGNVPGTDHQAARVRLGADPIDDRPNLVDLRTIGRRPGPPLPAVDRAQIPVLVCPCIPNADAMLIQVTNVRVAAQEPQQLMDDRPQVEPLGRQERKTGG
ncbi:MAG: hypothetical protein A2W31_02290 [Planctomycetes bacterium RBG_16_64_10]|nr:MAG: hypothetical protein A2W31_02290 [Planctomycetes bacterium RBG_16_64_10]